MKFTPRAFTCSAAIVLALACSMPARDAQAADSTVTFNMQVSAKNLDPRVSSIFLSCSIFGTDSQTLGFTSPNSVVDVPVSSSYNGQLSAKVVVPEAKVKDAKKWLCAVHRKGPNNQEFTGMQEWGLLEGKETNSWAMGNF